jgi:hypothetical protein
VRAWNLTNLVHVTGSVKVGKFNVRRNYISWFTDCPSHCSVIPRTIFSLYKRQCAKIIFEVPSVLWSGQIGMHKGVLIYVQYCGICNSNCTRNAAGSLCRSLNVEIATECVACWNIQSTKIIRNSLRICEELWFKIRCNNDVTCGLAPDCFKAVTQKSVLRDFTYVQIIAASECW